MINRDIVEHHVDQVRARHGARVDSAVVDARSLDLADGVADVALLLGPPYHLDNYADRLTALREASRVVRSHGIAFALGDLDERLADPVETRVLLDSLRALEADPDLLGLGPHLLATARVR